MDLTPLDVVRQFADALGVRVGKPRSHTVFSRVTIHTTPRINVDLSLEPAGRRFRVWWGRVHLVGRAKTLAGLASLLRDSQNTKLDDAPRSS